MAGKLGPIPREMCIHMAIQHGKMGYWEEAEIFAKNAGISMEEVRQRVFLEML